MSGLELLTAMSEGVLPASSIRQTVPVKMDVIDKGAVKFTVKADCRHLNPVGGVHGGFAATVLDSITGSAVHSTLDAGISFGTIPMAAVYNEAIAAAIDGMIEPEELAECVVEKLRKESLLIFPHAIVLEYMRNKTTHYYRWIGGINKLMRHIMGITK